MYINLVLCGVNPWLISLRLLCIKYVSNAYGLMCVIFCWDVERKMAATVQHDGEHARRRSATDGLFARLIDVLCHSAL